MKQSFFTLIVCLAAVPVLSFGTSGPPREHPDSEGWQELFEPDLSNAEFPESVWYYEQGALMASEDECIWTRKEYDNFVLDLEFRTAEGTNSGVIVYASDTENWIPNSVEIQIADDYHKKWSAAPKTWQCAAIFGHKPARERRVKQPGQWNRMTVQCEDSMIWVVLNGELVTEMDMGRWTSAKTNPDGTEIPSWLSRPKAELPTRGRIGLQGKHAGAPVWFRNLKIRELE